MSLELIICVDRDGGIGKDYSLPWHISSELKHFVSLTKGKNLIMGRRTFESLPYLAEDDRSFTVVSKTIYPGRQLLPKGDKHMSVFVYEDLWKAQTHSFDAFSGQPKIVIGGGEIYEQVLTSPELTEIHVSVLPDSYGCDVFVDVSAERLSTLGFELVSTENKVDFIYKKYKRTENG
jgi:dihydrofolate reductase